MGSICTTQFLIHLGNGTQNHVAGWGEGKCMGEDCLDLTQCSLTYWSSLMPPWPHKISSGCFGTAVPQCSSLHRIGQLIFEGLAKKAD